MLYQSTCVGFGYGPYRQRCFPDRSPSRPNPIRADTASRSSRLAGPGMFTWFPSATAFALALGAGSPCADWPCAGTLGLPAGGVLALLRSEEHTSELQSRQYLVCRLLLEKKKTRNILY